MPLPASTPLSTNAQRDSVDGMECKLFRHTYHPYHMHKQNMGLYVLTRELAPAEEQVVIAHQTVGYATKPHSLRKKSHPIPDGFSFFSG